MDDTRDFRESLVARFWGIEGLQAQLYISPGQHVPERYSLALAALQRAAVEIVVRKRAARCVCCLSEIPRLKKIGGVLTVSGLDGLEPQWGAPVCRECGERPGVLARAREVLGATEITMGTA
jgi:hypothetical protein